MNSVEALLKYLREEQPNADELKNAIIEVKSVMNKVSGDAMNQVITEHCLTIVDAIAEDYMIRQKFDTSNSQEVYS